MNARALLLLIALLPIGAGAQSVCPVFADMAITARALAVAGIDASLSETVMTQMYGGADGVRTIRQIIAEARASELPASEFSGLVLFWCESAAERHPAAEEKAI